MKNNPFLNRSKEIRSIWWVVIFYLTLMIFLFPLILLADRFSFEITLAHQFLLILVASLICQALRRKSLGDLVGQLNFIWIKELGVGLLIGAALMLLPALFLTILGFIHWQVNDFSYSIITSGFAIFILTALAEELLFRGFMFQRLIQSLGKWPAQLIIATLFLLTHINNPGMTGVVKALASINIFVASILFGIAYIDTKSLAMPLGLHFMANFMQGTVLGFGVSGDNDPSLLRPIFKDAPLWLSGGDFGIEASLAGLFILIMITVSLFFWRPAKAE